MLLMNFLGGIATLEEDIVNLFVKIITMTFLFSTMKTIRIDRAQYKSIAKFFTEICVVACMYNFYENFNMLNSSLLSMSAYEIVFKSFFLNRNQFGMFLVVCLFFIELFFEPGTKENI